ncbi:MAG: ABC transporter permease [Clostridiales bacterium]|nr:ABC transporter permease [Clostridiales bacterium]
MKPFSAFSYIRNNKGRSFALILVMACITVCFLAGMYVEHPGAVFAQTLDLPSDYVIVMPESYLREVNDETRDLFANIDSYLPSCADTIVPVSSIYVSFKTMMGYDNGLDMFLFTSEDDFREFNRVVDGIPSEVELTDGQIMLSRTLADNWGVKVGDVLERTDTWTNAGFYYGAVTVAYIEDIPGMQMFGICSGAPNSGFLILRGEPASVPGYETGTVNDALEECARAIKADYPHQVTWTNSIRHAVVKDQLSMMNLFLGGITVILGIVLSVTTNATFAAAYEKRRFEFSIYKAMGFGSRVNGKIISEVLVLNAIALTVGSLICALVIFTYNFLMKPHGIYFFAFSFKGLLATLICDLMVIVPVMILNILRIRKYDVTVW